MFHRSIFVLFLSLSVAFAEEPTFVSLPNSRVILTATGGWTVKEKNGEIGIYPPEQRAKDLISAIAARPVPHVVFDQPAKKPRTKIHLTRYRESETTLQAAIDAEIDRITARSPQWGSSNDRRSYKGSTPIRTQSGMDGLRADFYQEDAGKRRHTIVKYYFFDESGKIFRVCSHVYGDEARFKENEAIILSGLKFNETK